MEGIGMPRIHYIWEYKKFSLKIKSYQKSIKSIKSYQKNKFLVYIF